MAGEGHVKSTSSTKLTYDDFVNFPDDGLRHELIDGEHYVTPAPNGPHQRLVGRMFAALHAYFATGGGGEAFLSPFDVVLSNHDVVEPDLLVLLSDQGDILTHQNVRGAPALVVEVLSPGTRKRDRTIKHRLYDRAGVREYWLVDPDGMSITCLSARGRIITDARRRTEGGVGRRAPVAAAPGFLAVSDRTLRATRRASGSGLNSARGRNPRA